MPSLQLTAVPAWQSSKASHVSTPLQNKPSLQAALLATLSQALVASLHESVVQPTPSLQLTAVPTWQPSRASQVSTPLQKMPSLQEALFATLSQLLVVSLHESIVQTTPSLQFTVVPA